MARPTKHPKSGTYRVRLMIPEALREVALRLHGVRTELVENLRTKDAKEAVRLGPAALMRLNEKLEAIGRAADGRLPVPSDRDIALIGGEAYRWRIEAQGDNAGSPEHWRLHLDDIRQQFGDEDPQGNREVVPARQDRHEAREVLRGQGWSDDPAAVERAALAILGSRSLFAQTMLRRSLGDWCERDALGACGHGEGVGGLGS